MGEIRVAIAGVGNCASALVQGIDYYRGKDAAGLLYPEIGGYRLEHIRPVAAFDIDRRKVGRALHEAVFAPPNCTTVFQKDITDHGVEVQMGPVLDGVAGHMANYPDELAFRTSDAKPVDVARALKDSGAEVLVCYLPVGSEQAVRHYARACIEAGVAMVNCMPVFIASDPEWADEFKAAGLPVVGDDIKSQVGATMTHRTLARMMVERGAKIKKTYQLNTGGNTDFLNMLERKRLASKKLSKTEAVQSQLDVPLAPLDIHIGPSDYVPWQKDNKICFIRVEWEGFGGVPMNMELRMSVEDSPNSANVSADAIRCARIALDRRVGGALTEVSAFLMKHPPRQMHDADARRALEEWTRGAVTAGA